MDELGKFERLLNLIAESHDNIVDAIGKYEVKVEKVGSREEVIIDGEGGRFIAHLLINSQGLCLIVIPEDELSDRGPTPSALEKNLLETLGRRMVYKFLQFEDKSGWRISDLSAIFVKGEGRMILEYDGDKITITEAEIEEGNGDDQ